MSASIHDVRINALARIPDDRGAILHMLREDHEVFERFGEIYFSLVYPGVVKGWHIHKRMTLNYAVPVGILCLPRRNGTLLGGGNGGIAGIAQHEIAKGAALSGSIDAMLDRP